MRLLPAQRRPRVPGCGRRSPLELWAAGPLLPIPVRAGRGRRHVGDPVAAVAAADEATAREAANLLEVGYDKLRSSTNATPSRRAPLVHDTHAVSDSDAAYFGLRPLEGTNVCHRFRIRTRAAQGEPYTADPEPDDHAEGFDAAEVIVDERFHMPAVQHVAMEPHACIASWRDGRLEITTGTQTPFNMRQDLACLFGLPESDVRIVCPPMGGSFGPRPSCAPRPSPPRSPSAWTGRCGWPWTVTRSSSP